MRKLREAAVRLQSIRSAAEEPNLQVAALRAPGKPRHEETGARGFREGEQVVSQQGGTPEAREGVTGWALHLEQCHRHVLEELHVPAPPSATP